MFFIIRIAGVLEHFDREITIQLLQEQMKCGKYILIEIPSKYTVYSAGLTDERIYSMGALRQIVVVAGLSIESSFGFGGVMGRRCFVWVKRSLPHAAYRLIQIMVLAIAWLLLVQVMFISNILMNKQQKINYEDFICYR